MKRSIFTQATLTIALLAAACSAPDRDAAPTPARTAGWVTPPTIDTAHRTAAGLTINGRAMPLGRVVLRGAGETAYATGADAQGRFQLRIQAPAADTLFVVEAMEGQNGSPAPYRLLTPHDRAGPIALLAAGASTRRLDPGAGALDVIDSDGQALMASGRAPPGQIVSVTVGDGPARQARAGADGRWSVVLETATSAAFVTVGDRRYAYPGAGPAGRGLAVRPAPGGWSLTWELSDGAHQTSWFPAAG